MTAKSPKDCQDLGIQSQIPAQRTAIFAGSFHPFTIGHADIVRRGLEIFDRIVISIGVNAAKHTTEDELKALCGPLERIYGANPRVVVTAWSGLTGDLAKKFDARFLLRGVRSVKDYEYERDMADANRSVFGLETVILFADPELAYVSSSLVRELQAYGQDVSRFLP